MGRVLIIDDDPEMREMLGQVLKGARHEVVSSMEGGIVNVVIADLASKGSLESIIELRREFPEVAVLVLSKAADADATQTVARRIRAARIIQKPFQADELLAAVKQALKPKL